MFHVKRAWIDRVQTLAAGQLVPDNVGRLLGNDSFSRAPVALRRSPDGMSTFKHCRSGLRCPYTSNAGKPFAGILIIRTLV